MVNQITASSSAKTKSTATYASTPVGRKGSPIEIKQGTNRPTMIFDRQYSGHALDRMQGRGIPPSVVENAILTGLDSPGSRSGTTDYYDQVNDLTVVTNTKTGCIITVRQGSP